MRVETSQFTDGEDRDTGDDIPPNLLPAADGFGLEKIVANQKDQLRYLADDNLASRHRFGGDIEPLGMLDRNARRLLVVGLMLFWVLVAFVVVMVGR